jgi:hypothetical protein
MTAVYSGENTKTDVAFTTGTPHAGSHARDCDCKTTGEHVAVATNVRDTYGKSMDGANELRIIVDTLSHEMEHVRSSLLTAKREFQARYPDAPRFAGMVLNVLEDQYIDWQRLTRFRGLRSAHSFKVDRIMANGTRRPPLDNLEPSEQVVEGFLQMAFAGYVKGWSDTAREVQEAIVKTRPLVDLVRNEHDAHERESIAHTCVEILLAAVPEPETVDEYTEENQGQMPTDQPADLSPEDVQDLLDDMEPGDVEEPDDASGGIAVDPDEYDVPEWLEDEMEQADGDEAEVSSAPKRDDPWRDDDHHDEDGREDGDEHADGDAGDGPGSDGDTESAQHTPETAGDTDEASAGGDDTEGSTSQETQPTRSGQNQQPRGSPPTEHEVGGDGDRDPSQTPSGADPIEDPIEEGIEELEQRERERDAGEHWNAGDNDYQAPDDEFQRRYQRIEREVQREQTGLGQQKRRRDQRIDHHQERPAFERRWDSAETIRELLRTDGTASDIVDAFTQFKTQDRWRPDTRGERLHTRNATRRLAGDYSTDRVYDRKLKAEVGDRCVGVAFDLSGSMKGVNGLRTPKLALGALYLATKTIGDDLLATGYKTYENHPQKNKYEPVLDLITGPQESFEWTHLDGAKAGMYTPTADGVQYTQELLKRSHRREKVMVVVTDGKANIPLGGSTATNTTKGQYDAKRAVNTARQDGIKVLGMAVDDVGSQHMDAVFGSGKWVQAGSDTLTEDLVAIYKDQMRTGQQRRA